MLYVSIKIIINFISLIAIESICMADLNGCLLNKDSKIAKKLRAQTQCLENRGVHIETVNENTISLCRMVGGNITKTLENVVIVSFKVVDKSNIIIVRQQMLFTFQIL